MMFLDIRNLTGFSDRHTAAEVVGTVNRRWEEVVPITHDHRGHIDKFVGDGLLAVFGAPGDRTTTPITRLPPRSRSRPRSSMSFRASSGSRAG